MDGSRLAHPRDEVQRGEAVEEELERKGLRPGRIGAGDIERKTCCVQGIPACRLDVATGQQTLVGGIADA